MGGFECATHCRRDRKRLDILAATRHDICAAADYRLLASAGIRTVRDGLRWHRIEAERGTYDWSSFLPMLRASHDACTEAGTQVTQVIWDLCHWGVPDWVDPFAPEFPALFAAFARAAAELICEEKQRAGIGDASLFCPINEISFWSWVGGDVEHFAPFGRGRGPELKRQLASAAIAATRAVRQIEPAARFIQAEPLIHISAATHQPAAIADAARYTEAQFETWDMLAGRLHPELGGSEDTLDMLGANFYWNNQWVHNGERTPLGHPLHRPLHEMLAGLYRRYSRPLLVTETGAEGGTGVGWLGYIGAELRRALAEGVPVSGLCLYPAMDYPGWDDSRQCPCGPIATDARYTERYLREDLLAELAVQKEAFGQVFAHAAKTVSVLDRSLGEPEALYRK